MNNELQISRAANGVVAALLTLFLGPLGAFFSWWLLCGFSLWESVLKTLAFVALYAFIFGLAVLTAVLFAPIIPFLAAAEIPLLGFVYLVLQIILVISVYKSATLADQGQGEWI